MRYKRELQFQFLEDELKAQTDAFDKLLKSSARYLLLETGELFVAQFRGFTDNGDMVLKFSNKRALPRRRDYLYCMTLHRHLSNYKNWTNETYGDLIKDKTNQTEVVCLWHSPLQGEEANYTIAGFRGVDLDFAEWVHDVPGAIVVLGPNRPPIEYLSHLQELVRNNRTPSVASILDADFQPVDYAPTILSDKQNIPSFLLGQMNLCPALVLQGPPGTGKTFQIASVCATLAAQGYSVLVTALTNRALMEIAAKPSLEELSKEKRVFKTKITYDEARENRYLQEEKLVTPKRGSIILSTFYITSGTAADLTAEAPFDFVVMDEASQALLPMIAAARGLGKKTIYVGDINQLPPVVELRDSKIRQNGYRPLVEGLDLVARFSPMPTYQLGASFRLTERAVQYTGRFYEGRLSSRAECQTPPTFGLPFLHCDGGPTLVMTDCPIGLLAPESAVAIATAIIQALFLHAHKTCHVSVLSCMRQTVRALQRSITVAVGYKENLLVDTIARVQGLTTDVCVLVIPNTTYLHQLERRLFNVATSRARMHTIIVADKEVMSYSRMDASVRNYMADLYENCSCYIPWKESKAPNLLEMRRQIGNDMSSSMK